MLGLGIIKACGTTKVVNLASNVGALITYGMNGNVLVGIGIKCTIFAILGSWVGSGLALKNGAKIVRPIMIVAMLLLLLKIASDMFLDNRPHCRALREKKGGRHAYFCDT